jgi:hypothetical protein
MPAGHDDVLERLEVAIHAWNLEIAQLRGALSAELDALGAQLEQLKGAIRSGSQPVAQEPDRGPVSGNAGAGLGVRVAELGVLLEAARSKIEELERQARRPLEELAGDGEENLAHRLSEALRGRYEAHEEIVSLRAESDLLRRANAQLSGPVAPPEGQIGAFVEVFDEDGRRRRLGEVLMALGLLDERQLNAALTEQSMLPHRRLGAILVEKGVTSEDIVARILARQLGLPFVRLEGNVADEAATRVITGAFAWARECVPIAVSPTSLVLATPNPFNLAVIEEVELATGRRVDPVVASSGDIRNALERYYGPRDNQARP